MKDQAHPHRFVRRYIEVVVEQMVGVLLLVFVRPRLAEHVGGVHAEVVKTGFGSESLGVKAGNKGGIAVRLNVFGTSLCVINTHFPAGQSHPEERNATYAEVLQGLATGFARARGGPHQPPLCHDLCVWLGDLNYRVELPNDEVRRCVSEGQLEGLMAFDQLKIAQQMGAAFPEFVEGVVVFPPTYKYDAGTSMYDTSEKQRVPSWTDRVLWRARNGEVTALAYDAAQEVLVSDHKPVGALLTWRCALCEQGPPLPTAQYELSPAAAKSETLPGLADTVAAAVGEQASLIDLVTGEQPDESIIPQKIDTSALFPTTSSEFGGSPPPPTAIAATAAGSLFPSSSNFDLSSQLVSSADTGVLEGADATALLKTHVAMGSEASVPAAPAAALASAATVPSVALVGNGLASTASVAAPAPFAASGMTAVAFSNLAVSLSSCGKAALGEGRAKTAPFGSQFVSQTQTALFPQTATTMCPAHVHGDMHGARALGDLNANPPMKTVPSCAHSVRAAASSTGAATGTTTKGDGIGCSIGSSIGSSISGAGSIPCGNSKMSTAISGFPACHFDQMGDHGHVL